MSNIEGLSVMKVTATLYGMHLNFYKRDKIGTLAHLRSYLTQTHMYSKWLKAVFSNLPGNNKRP